MPTVASNFLDKGYSAVRERLPFRKRYALPGAEVVLVNEAWRVQYHECVVLHVKRLARGTKRLGVKPPYGSRVWSYLAQPMSRLMRKQNFYCPSSLVEGLLPPTKSATYDAPDIVVTRGVIDGNRR